MQSCGRAEVLPKTEFYPVLIKVFHGREKYFFFRQYYFVVFVLPDSGTGVVIF